MIPLPSGGTSSRVYGVSADGTVAAGYSGFSGVRAASFTWTATGGRVDFGLEPGMPESNGAEAISGDGLTVAGSALLTEGGRAYRWSAAGGFQDLGLLPGAEYSVASGVSGDGSVVVGRNQYASSDVAFRWTQAEGMTSLGYTRPGHFYSEANAISRNGVMIVGLSFGATTTDAFAWTSTTGMTILPPLPGQTMAYAMGVNQDGSIAVGSSSVTVGGQGTLINATMWVNGTPIDLGLASGYFRSSATAVNDTGTLVAGFVEQSGSQYAAVWTPQTGMRTLVDFLSLHGVTVPAGVSPLTCTGVSADGNTIVGYTGLPGQVRQGFVATIPAPGPLVAITGMAITTFRRRRQGDAAPRESGC